MSYNDEQYFGEKKPGRGSFFGEKRSGRGSFFGASPRRSPKKHHPKSREMCDKRDMKWVKRSKHARGYCRKSKSRRSRSRRE